MEWLNWLNLIFQMISALGTLVGLWLAFPKLKEWRRKRHGVWLVKGPKYVVKRSNVNPPEIELRIKNSYLETNRYIICRANVDVADETEEFGVVSPHQNGSAEWAPSHHNFYFRFRKGGTYRESERVIHIDLNEISAAEITSGVYCTSEIIPNFKLYLLTPQTLQTLVKRVQNEWDAILAGEVEITGYGP